MAASQRDAYRNYLKGIADQTRQDVGAVGPTLNDDTVADVAGEFRDAVLALYNNTLRVCGVPVGDADSESNAILIYERLGRTLYESIGDGLAKARLAEIERLERDAAAKGAEIDRLIVAHNAATREAHSIGDSLAQARAEHLATTNNIAALKELV